MEEEELGMWSFCSTNSTKLPNWQHLLETVTAWFYPNQTHISNQSKGITIASVPAFSTESGSLRFHKRLNPSRGVSWLSLIDQRESASQPDRFPRLYLNHFKWVPAIVFNNHTVWISGETMGEEGGEGERRNDPSKLPAEKSFPSPLLFWNDTQTLNNCLRAVRGQHNYWLPFSFVLFAFPTFPSPFLFLFLFIFFFFFLDNNFLSFIRTSKHVTANDRITCSLSSSERNARLHTANNNDDDDDDDNNNSRLANRSSTNRDRLGPR